MTEPSITLTELEEYPTGTKLKTIKQDIKDRAMVQQLQRETAINLERAKL